jgi:hypothetical protein
MENLTMASTKLRIEAAVRSLSPRRRRWHRFLAGLTLDPEALPMPLEAPSERDFIICGASRTGTSLLSAVLFQPPNVVTVMEPWDGMRLPPADLFRSLREEIESTGRMTRGRLNVEALLADGQVEWGRDGEYPADVQVNANYLMGVKWPAYWRYLELLPNTKFLVCLRHPVAVINSFRRTGGRLAEGFEYDIAFNRRMNHDLGLAETHAGLRRMFLYEYVNSRLLPHLTKPNVFIVRYERWFTEPSRLLDELGSFLGVEVGSPHARIRAPASTSAASDGEKALIRRLCPSAAGLGYELP